jgi:Hint domain
MGKTKVALSPAHHATRRRFDRWHGAEVVARTTPAEAQAGPCPSTIPCNCFLKGTLISTPSGAKRIDELAVGDLVTTIDGSARPIQFISVNSYRKSDPTKPWVADARPVLVRKSALSENVPNRDLYLTRAHSLYLDGVLIPVHNLINGSTIVVDPAEHLSELDYFHIKLESHDVRARRRDALRNIANS